MNDSARHAAIRDQVAAIAPGELFSAAGLPVQLGDRPRVQRQSAAQRRADLLLRKFGVAADGRGTGRRQLPAAGGHRGGGGMSLLLAQRRNHFREIRGFNRVWAMSRRWPHECLQDKSAILRGGRTSLDHPVVCLKHSCPLPCVVHQQHRPHVEPHNEADQPEVECKRNRDDHQSADCGDSYRHWARIVAYIDSCRADQFRHETENHFILPNGHPRDHNQKEKQEYRGYPERRLRVFSSVDPMDFQVLEICFRSYGSEGVRYARLCFRDILFSGSNCICCRAKCILNHSLKARDSLLHERGGLSCLPCLLDKLCQRALHRNCRRRINHSKIVCRGFVFGNAVGFVGLSSCIYRPEGLKLRNGRNDVRCGKTELIQNILIVCETGSTQIPSNKKVPDLCLVDTGVSFQQSLGIGNKLVVNNWRIGRFDLIPVLKRAKVMLWLIENSINVIADERSQVSVTRSLVFQIGEYNTEQICCKFFLLKSYLLRCILRVWPFENHSIVAKDFSNFAQSLDGILGAFTLIQCRDIHRIPRPSKSWVRLSLQCQRASISPQAAV